MKWLACCLLFILTINAHALEPNSFSSAVDEQRFLDLTKEIRCVVCQGQSIADSNAPLANDLRAKIMQMVLDKKSDEEIKTYLVKRYGEFILLRPRVNQTTMLLWTFPFLGLAAALMLLWRVRSKM